MNPYFELGDVVLYLGDARELLPVIPMVGPVVCITDPPYQETNLAWDRWPEGWLAALDDRFTSLWCFGSMRMFLWRSPEFRDAGWSIAQDLVWEKQNGTNSHADRFRRVHENIVQWFRGDWSDVYRSPVMTADATKRTVRGKQRPTHWKHIAPMTYTSHDGGPRHMRSVLRVRNCHGSAVHPTQKPLGVLAPLVEYSCPADGIVVDPFVGSGSSLIAARDAGRRAIGIDIDERVLEKAAQRLTERFVFEPMPEVCA